MSTNTLSLLHFSSFIFHAACGQATLTIPGTNITIPIGNALGNVTGQVHTNQQQQTQQQTQSQPTQPQPSQQQNQQQSQNQTQQQTTQQQQTQQQQSPATITIPGTNIQIPTSVAAANGIISAGNAVKVEGTGKLF